MYRVNQVSLICVIPFSLVCLMCIIVMESSWNTLLGWAARSGQGKLVEDLSAKMVKVGVQGDVTTRNIRLQHLLASRPGEAMQYFEELRRKQEQQLRE